MQRRHWKKVLIALGAGFLFATLFLLLLLQKPPAPSTTVAMSTHAEAPTAPLDIESMRTLPPGGDYTAKTTGTCRGVIHFTTASSEQPAKAMISGSLMSLGLTAGQVMETSDFFAAHIPPQPLQHTLREDGWQVAIITGTFYWYEPKRPKASYKELPQPLQAAAEEIEHAEDDIRSTQQRLSALSLKAVNSDDLRKELEESLKTSLIRYNNLEAFFEKASTRLFIPRRPNLITHEAVLTYQWGSTPVLEPPASEKSKARIELKPAETAE
jgi:hypothetical protein